MGHCRTLEPRKDVVKVKTATKYINFFGDLDDYHFLLLGTTKRIKLMVTTTAPDENEVTLELDDRSDRFEIGFPIYKEFNKVEHKGKIIGYNSKHQLYEVEYEDGDKEEFYHNKIHAHKDCVKIAPSKSKKKNIQI